MNRLLLTLLSLAAASLARAQNADEMAKQVANPIASLTSVPVQFNDEYDAGVNGDGHRLRVNVQPVVPMSIGENWNLISRTIVPIIRQKDIFPGAGEQSGIGDATQSLFFSPKALTSGGWTWGVGPVFLLPTASDGLLGNERWGAGPTFVALRQTPTGWTYGVLINHIVSFAGDGQRADINATFTQPFVSKRIGPGRTVSMSVESTYDWERSAWNAPVNLGISQILPIGKQLVSLQLGGAYYVEAPRGAPEWGARLTVTFLYPKR